jgi:nucleotide-binding universal stress UspA family protein
MWTIRTILVPVDFSALSEAALGTAGRLAQAYGARIVAVYVAPMDLVYGELLRPPSDPRLYLNSLEDRLQLARPAEYPVPYITSLKEGDSGAEILRTADETECDLIVMGSHGRGGLFRLALGSVAERVVRDAPCPVLVVKTTGTTASG